jgi:ElaB/YqjD/DUF883 family membrane-anchored ribosome-binding protein
MATTNHATNENTTPGEFAESFKRIQSDVSELLGMTRDQARAGIDALGKTARDTSRKAVENTQTTISSYPLRSAGVALAAGALLGWLIARR